MPSVPAPIRRLIFSASARATISSCLAPTFTADGLAQLNRYAHANEPEPDLFVISHGTYLGTILLPSRVHNGDCWITTDRMTETTARALAAQLSSAAFTAAMTLYLVHIGSALAAVLPYDAVVTPGVFRPWILRAGLVGVLTATAGASIFTLQRVVSAGSGTVAATVGGFVLLITTTIFLAYLGNRRQ